MFYPLSSPLSCLARPLFFWLPHFPCVFRSLTCLSLFLVISYTLFLVIFAFFLPLISLVPYRSVSLVRLLPLPNSLSCPCFASLSNPPSSTLDSLSSPYTLVLSVSLKLSVFHFHPLLLCILLSQPRVFSCFPSAYVSSLFPRSRSLFSSPIFHARPVSPASSLAASFFPCSSSSALSLFQPPVATFLFQL